MTARCAGSSRSHRCERRWLIVGHGSVGSQLVRRLVEQGESDVFVLDPLPRVAVRDARPIQDAAELGAAVDYVMSCVPPAAAHEVPDLVRPAIARRSMLMDWTSVAPRRKRETGQQVQCAVIDVALMDSIDAQLANPRLAISGDRAAEASALLEKLGFQVDVAGDDLGDAALLKYTRSIFMKSLESLCLEFVALAALVDGRGIVASSLANNLGEQFVSFMDVLVATNRVHGRRRADELAEALNVFGEMEISLPMARRAAAVLAEHAAAIEVASGAGGAAEPLRTRSTER